MLALTSVLVAEREQNRKQMIDDCITIVRLFEVLFGTEIELCQMRDSWVVCIDF